MKKIYEQLKDLHVRNIIFYGNSEDGKLYVDEALTKQATLAQVEDAFVKRQLLIKINEGMCTPVILMDTAVMVNEEITFSVAVPEAE